LGFILDLNYRVTRDDLLQFQPNNAQVYTDALATFLLKRFIINDLASVLSAASSDTSNYEAQFT